MCLPYSSYDVSSENLVLVSLSSPDWYFSFFSSLIITFCKVYVYVPCIYQDGTFWQVFCMLLQCQPVKKNKLWSPCTWQFQTISSKYGRIILVSWSISCCVVLNSLKVHKEFFDSEDWRLSQKSSWVLISFKDRPFSWLAWVTPDHWNYKICFRGLLGRWTKLDKSESKWFKREKKIKINYYNGWELL